MPEFSNFEISNIPEGKFYIPGQGVKTVNDDLSKEDIIELVKGQKAQASVINTAELGLEVLRKKLANAEKCLLSAEVDKEIALGHMMDAERSNRRGDLDLTPPLGGTFPHLKKKRGRVKYRAVGQNTKIIAPPPSPVMGR